MEQKLNRVKNYFTIKRSDGGLDNAVDPQIGFKVSFCEITKELKVKVIGARQLPTSYGSVKPNGYLVKVRFFFKQLIFYPINLLKIISCFYIHDFSKYSNQQIYFYYYRLNLQGVPLESGAPL